MNTFTSLKYAAVLVPALAVGIPMAIAGDEKPDDPQESEKTTSAFGSERQNERADQRRDGLHNEFLETMPARGFQSDSLIGQEVKSRNDNKSVGEISNLLLDENGQIVAVVLSVGGTLGMGEHNVAIAWDQIDRRVDGDETTLLVSQTQQNLKNAPKYTSDTKDASQSKYSGGDKKHNYADKKRDDQRQDTSRSEQPATASTKSHKNRSDDKKSMAYKSDERKSDANEVGQSQFLAAIPVSGYHSDNLVGQEVTNRSNNESIGEVSDLVLDENGQVMALIVSIGGVLGLGERDVAISWDQIDRNVDGDEITLTTDLNEESLKDAPKYSREQKKSHQ